MSSVAPSPYVVIPDYRNIAYVQWEKIDYEYGKT